MLCYISWNTGTTPTADNSDRSARVAGQASCSKFLLRLSRVASASSGIEKAIHDTANEGHLAGQEREANCSALSGLGVKLQDVIPGQAEAADRGVGVEASMRTVPVIAVQPSGQCAASLIRVLEGGCVGPFRVRSG